MQEVIQIKFPKSLYLSAIGATISRVSEREDRIFLVYLALIILLVASGLLMPRSVRPENLTSVIRWSSLLGLVAIGQTIVILCGGIDLSVGMIVFLTVILGADLMRGQDVLALPVSILCLCVGSLIGLVNGLSVVKLKVPPIVTTLGMMTILSGVIWIYSGGVPRGGVAPALISLGRAKIWGFMPIPGVIWILISILGIIILRKATFGRKVYAVGNNPITAQLSGINVDLITILSYVISGLTAAVAGLLLLGFLGMSTLRFTDMYTLGSIAAVIIGGTTFFKGVGSIEGTMAGTFIVRFLFNLMVMFRVAEAGRRIAEGLIIIGIVAMYSMKRKD